ncbi:hypothetical protein FOL47_005603, partial [Perkinsus chesapeaki]
DDYKLPLEILHIKGLHNSFADQLSRLPSTLPELPPLGGDGLKDKGDQRGPTRRQAAVALCVLDDQLCIERCGHGAHLVYMPCFSSNGGDPMPEGLDPDCRICPDRSPIHGLVLAAGPSGNDQGGQHPKFDDTMDLANMDPEEVLELESQAIEDTDFSERARVYGVKLKDLVMALQGLLDKKPVHQSALNLA